MPPVWSSWNAVKIGLQTLRQEKLVCSMTTLMHWRAAIAYAKAARLALDHPFSEFSTLSSGTAQSAQHTYLTGSKLSAHGTARDTGAYIWMAWIPADHHSKHTDDSHLRWKRVIRIRWNSIVIWTCIKRLYIWFYTTLVIEFVLHRRFRAILFMKIIPNIRDVQRL